MATVNMSALQNAATARAACPAKRVRASTARVHSARRAVVKCVAAPDAPSETKIFNFSAGPAVLPQEVLKTAQAEMTDWHGSGMSVMEMSHRGGEFKSIIEKAEADLRTLLDIPENYKVLFVQGGASTQFAAIPLNLTKDSSATADHILTGAWGKKAIAEAKKFCNAHTAATSAETNFDTIPPIDSWNLTEGAAYVHTCSNETIGGVEYKEDPIIATGAPLVTDMSSNFLSKPIDVSKYGVIYAGAQKNVGPSGVTILIVREDLIGNARPECPTMLDWATMANDGSLYNTPPSYGIYMCGLTFQYLLDQGGLAEIQKKNEAKAAILYKTIETSDGFYSCPVDPAYRSLMNVPFRVVPNELEGEFLEEAKKLGLLQLKGHRSVGGIRASIYNAMPQDGVEALVQLMLEFKEKHA